MNNREKETIILTGNVVTPSKLIKDGSVIVEKGKIASVKNRKYNTAGTDAEIIDAGDGFIVPGFIDLHVHGGGGFDVMDGSCGAVKEIAKVHCRHGTTAFLATTMTMSKDKILKSLEAVSEAFIKGTGTAEVLGVHLEGPYINPLKKGAQKEEDIRNASIEELIEFNEASGNLIRIVSLAPEMPGAIELIKWLGRHDIIASVAHSDATYTQMLEGIEAGLTHVTHIFNAMRGFDHREPGVAGAALFAPGLTVEMIADGIHLHPLAMKLVTTVKDKEKIILITDAMRAAGKADGTYNLGGQEVFVSQGNARLKDGTLAGSVLTLDSAVRNMIKVAGISLEEAIGMVTINPAVCLGIEDSKGSLEPGRDADIVILDEKLEVNATIIKGKVVYKRK